jgi:antitoxin component YwqK of YwqJK toxin-antitoxin module
VLEGIWTEWYENGQKNIEGNYKEGELEGQVTVWQENGKKEK